MIQQTAFALSLVTHLNSLQHLPAQNQTHSGAFLELTLLQGKIF